MAQDLESPFDDPRRDLTPTGERLLAAARAVLAEEGLSGLTIKAVTERSGENIAAVHYHFGNKEGLLRALLESHTYDASASLLRQASAIPPGPERTDTWIDGMREVTEDDESFVAFFELLPAALRDPVLHERLAGLYEWYRDSHVDVLRDEVGDERSRTLAVLIVAVIDGLAIQRALAPEVDTRGAMDVLKSLLRELGREPEA